MNFSPISPDEFSSTDNGCDDINQSNCYWKDVWRTLYSMRKSWQLCDLFLYSEEGILFKAHSIVVAASSAVLYKQLVERKPTFIERVSETEHRLFGVTADVLQVTIDFIYGVAPETIVNFKRLQKGADKLGITAASLFCRQQINELQNIARGEPDEPKKAGEDIRIKGQETKTSSNVDISRSDTDSPSRAQDLLLQCPYLSNLSTDSKGLVPLKKRFLLKVLSQLQQEESPTSTIEPNSDSTANKPTAMRPQDTRAEKVMNTHELKPGTQTMESTDVNVHQLQTQSHLPEINVLSSSASKTPSKSNCEFTEVKDLKGQNMTSSDLDVQLSNKHNASSINKPVEENKQLSLQQTVSVQQTAMVQQTKQQTAEIQQNQQRAAMQSDDYNDFIDIPHPIPDLALGDMTIQCPHLQKLVGNVDSYSGIPVEVMDDNDDIDSESQDCYDDESSSYRPALKVPTIHRAHNTSELTAINQNYNAQDLSSQDDMGQDPKHYEPTYKGKPSIADKSPSSDCPYWSSSSSHQEPFTTTAGKNGNNKIDGATNLDNYCQAKGGGYTGEVSTSYSSGQLSTSYSSYTECRQFNNPVVSHENREYKPYSSSTADNLNQRISTNQHCTTSHSQMTYIDPRCSQPSVSNREQSPPCTTSHSQMTYIDPRCSQPSVSSCEQSPPCTISHSQTTYVDPRCSQPSVSSREQSPDLVNNHNSNHRIVPTTSHLAPNVFVNSQTVSRHNTANMPLLSPTLPYNNRNPQSISSDSRPHTDYSNSENMSNTGVSNINRAPLNGFNDSCDVSNIDGVHCVEPSFGDSTSESGSDDHMYIDSSVDSSVNLSIHRDPSMDLDGNVATIMENDSGLQLIDNASIYRLLKEKCYINREGKRMYRCILSGCDYNNKIMEYVQSHLYHRHGYGNPQISCDQCPRKYFSESQLKTHFKQTHDGSMKQKLHSCEDCGESFKTSQSLHMHRLKLHGKGKLFSCEDCTFKSPRKKDLQGHMISQHDKAPPGVRIYQCEYCSYKCIDRNRFSEHEASHTQERSFKCEHCGNFYATRRGLRNHKKYHSNDRPHVCNICNASFKVRAKLRDHMRLLHIQKGEKPYKCGHCEFRASVRGNVNQHIRNVHKGQPIKVIDTMKDHRKHVKDYDYANLKGSDIREVKDASAAGYASVGNTSQP